jgi:ATP-dependent protease ClpP protease subunit
MAEIKSLGSKNIIDWLDMKLNIQFKYGIDLANRTILFTKDINSLSFNYLHNAMSFLENTSLSGAENEPIIIKFSSAGGDVYDMFSIISRIQSSPCKIIMHGIGEIQSAAVLIFASADERLISKYATIMVHHIQFGLNTSRSEDVRNEVKHTDQLEARMHKFLADNSLKPANFWSKTGKTSEHYVDAETAIKWGLADRILEIDDEPK